MFTDRLLEISLRFSLHLKNVSCFSWVDICRRQQARLDVQTENIAPVSKLLYFNH